VLGQLNSDAFLCRCLFLIVYTFPLCLILLILGVLRIRIIRANYGRTDSTTCSSGQPLSQLSNTNCYSYNTLSLFCCRCEPQQTCQVPATNSVFSDPCVGTYKYLKVVYICV
ncbi:rhamnose-binding lectin-like, partial [Ictalurus furcatus]|uniref:rhamnose-binding lectin-like n=1 Tax=Ictalurus furcatus TaxID=66913 RepID=UPI0023507BEC